MAENLKLRIGYIEVGDRQTKEEYKSICNVSKDGENKYMIANVTNPYNALSYTKSQWMKIWKAIKVLEGVE